MLANQSVLSQTAIQSIIASESMLNPQQGKFKRVLSADLLLTALIDAFSILVIFLLMSFSSSGDFIHLGKDQELPMALLSENLERYPVVKLEDHRIYLEDKEVGAEGLIEAMLLLRQQHLELHPQAEFPGVVTIQADRRTEYEELNQIVVAAASAGYSDIRFAVLRQ